MSRGSSTHGLCSDLFRFPEPPLLDEAGEEIAVTANELHLPVGERARLRLTSDNVIHSFWAPNLQGKTFLIPGKVNHLYAEPEGAGEWRGQCAEFCGLQHALMGFVVVAEPPDAFDTWLAEQAGWITSTHQIKPGALMPATAREPEELQALLDFLEPLE